MIRTVDARVDVYRNGGKLTELIPVDSPEITCKSSGEIKTSMSGSFLPNDDVDWLQDELHPILIIDGEEHPCGVFLPTTIVNNVDDSTKTVRVEAYDRCWRLKAQMSSTRICFAKGYSYITAIKALLNFAGINLVIISATGSYTLPETREWDPCTDVLSIVNELLSEINCNDIWFDNNGYAVVSPKQEPDAANIAFYYDENDISCLMQMNVEEKLDFFDTPNKFIVICGNADKDTSLTSVVTNDNPASPLSTVRRGLTIAKKYKVNNIATQAALDVYAKYLCRSSMFASETITIKTALQVGHGINDVVALNHSLVSGMCVETGWKMSLCAGGEMTHTLEKVVYDLG